MTTPHQQLPAGDRKSAEEFVATAYRALLGRPPGKLAESYVRGLIESPNDYGWVLRKLVATPEFQIKWSRDASAAYSIDKDPTLKPYLIPQIVDATRDFAAHVRWNNETFSAFATTATGAPGPVGQQKARETYFRFHRDRFRELLNGADYLLSHSNVKQPKLLEVGGSIFSIFLSKAFPDASIDILDQRTSEFLKPFTRYHFHVDLEAVRESTAIIPDAKYHIVFFSEVIEHLLANPVRVLRYLFQYLKPNGYLFLTTPNFFNSEYLQKISRRRNPQPVYPAHDEAGRIISHHVREYCMSELLQFCSEAGGKVFAFRFSSCWDEPESIANLQVDQLRNLTVVAQRN